MKSLVIECGGLPGTVLRGILQSEFPALEKLELYLGEEQYGASFTMSDLEPLLSGIVFPNLRSLGLRDSEWADEVAAAVAQAPVLSRLTTLDLSLGNLSDAGAKCLLESPGVARLKKLDLHHHYISRPLMARLAEAGPLVQLDDMNEPDEYKGKAVRYIAIGE